MNCKDCKLRRNRTMLSEEEKESIEQLKSWREYIIKNKEKVNKVNDLEFYLRTVLNLIAKLKKENKEKDKYIKNSENITTEMSNDINKLLLEIKEKDKQIDLMAEYISNLDIDEDFCKEQADNNCDDINREVECKDCIKQYFEKQVEEKGEEKCQTGVKEI